MKEYYLVKYDNHYGNMDYKNSLITYLIDNKFMCMGGYWGVPLYWIDIINKIYIPGRPGVAFGKAIGNHQITFRQFKRIYKNER